MGPEKHEIAELAAMAVLAVCGVVPCGEDVGNLWEPTFMRRMKEIQALAAVPNRYYDVSGYDHHQPTPMRDFVIHGVAGRVTFCAPIQERRDIGEDAAPLAGEAPSGRLAGEEI